MLHSLFDALHCSSENYSLDLKLDLFIFIAEESFLHMDVLLNRETMCIRLTYYIG